MIYVAGKTEWAINTDLTNTCFLGYSTDTTEGQHQTIAFYITLLLKYFLYLLTYILFYGSYDIDIDLDNDKWKMYNLERIILVDGRYFYKRVISSVICVLNLSCVGEHNGELVCDW